MSHLPAQLALVEDAEASVWKPEKEPFDTAKSPLSRKNTQQSLHLNEELSGSSMEPWQNAETLSSF